MEGTRYLYFDTRNKLNDSFIFYIDIIELLILLLILDRYNINWICCQKIQMCMIDDTLK